MSLRALLQLKRMKKKIYQDYICFDSKGEVEDDDRAGNYNNFNLNNPNINS